MPCVSLVHFAGLLGVCILGFSACATQLLHTARAIELGASQEQVRDILGAPQDRQVRGQQEAWQYCDTGVAQDTFVVIWFVESKMTGMSTYKNAVGDSGFFCSSHLRSIRWEDAPQITSERQ